MYFLVDIDMRCLIIEGIENFINGTSNFDYKYFDLPTILIDLAETFAVSF